MAGFINKEQELTRLTKEIEKLKGEIVRIEHKLSNEAFITKAPEQVMLKSGKKCRGYLDNIEKLQQQYQAIEML